MKVLIINDLLVAGGAELISLNIKTMLSNHGYDTCFLAYDDDFDDKLKYIDDKSNLYNIKINTKNKIKSYYNLFLFNPFLYFKIRKILKKINPDKIIVNNIAQSTITQLKALKGYDTIQIVHDYGIVCPKGTCVKDNLEECFGYKSNKCVECCTLKNTKFFLKLFYKMTKKKEKLRKKYIKKFIAPSQKLTDRLVEYGYDAVCINNPISHEGFDTLEYKKLENTRKYLYVGLINENKGILKFLEIFNEFSKDKDVSFEIIGRMESDNIQNRVNDLIANNPKIKYLGQKRHEELIRNIEMSDYLIVPSLWIENYPTTALEGLLYGSVVLGSNRGGVPEIISDGRGIIYNILDKASVLEVLNRSYTITEEEYNDIRKKGNDYVLTNNSSDRHYSELIKLLDSK